MIAQAVSNSAHDQEQRRRDQRDEALLTHSLRLLFSGPLDTAPPPSIETALPMSELVVEIVEGPDSGKQVELSGPLEIGRDPSCDLSLDDELASRHHLRIVPQNGTVLAEDLGSTNGTFVNDMQLHGSVVVNPGDHLLVGVTMLQLRTKNDVARRPTLVRPKPPAFAIASRRPDYVPSAIDLPDLGRQAHRLDPLLDVRTKHRARVAPIGVAILVTFAIILFLALR